MLIKDSAFEDSDLLGGRIVELSALVASQIPDKDALLYMRAQCFSLILLHIHKAASDAQVRDIWFATIEGCIECGDSRQRRGESAV